MAGAATSAGASRAATPPPRTDAANGRVLGAVLVTGGGVWLARQAGAAIPLEAALSVVLIVLGFGLVLTPRTRGGAGLVIAGIALSLMLASTSSIDVGSLHAGIGDRLERPTTMAVLQPEYELGVGRLVLDLGDLDVPEGTTQVSAVVGVGDLRLVVPADVAVEVRIATRVGGLQVFGHHRGGGRTTYTYRDPGFGTAARRLLVRTSVSVGQVEVERGA